MRHACTYVNAGFSAVLRMTAGSRASCRWLPARAKRLYSLGDARGGLAFAGERGSLAFAGWEVLLVLLAAGCAFGLGAANLGLPSLWHDEAIQVYVANSILKTGRPLVPSGDFCASSPLFNAILAGVIAFFGDGEAAVRMPSVWFAAANVVLAYLVLRPLLGSPTAVLAAWLLALNPWSVSWSREARFYAFQETAYLAMMALVWSLFAGDAFRRNAAEGNVTDGARRPWALSAAVGAVYLCAVFTSLHSVLFLAAPGAAAFLYGVGERFRTRRWAVICCAVALAGGLTMLGYYLLLPRADSLAIFKEAHIGTRVTDPVRADRLYYLSWLWSNLSAGLFAAALLGFVLMVWREGRRGLFAALAFWAPVLVLTFLVSYRRPRFMYFAFPFYIAAVSYAVVCMVRFVAKARRPWWRLAVAFSLVLVIGRLALSEVYLTRDSIRTARGADATLATRHPQWRKPCRYVKEHLAGDTAVIATTYIPVYYYVGRVDDWYPSRCIPWEIDETGLPGLRDVQALEAFVAAHPKGYFVAEWWRFDVHPEFAPDRAWVQAHMKRIDEASSADVTLYAWGMDAAPHAGQDNAGQR